MRTTWFGAILISSVLAGCANTPPDHALTENVETMSARVSAVAFDQRLVSLEGEDGAVTTVQAGPEVRNLEQVAPGDKVVVRYYQAIATQLKAPGESATLGRIEAATGDARAPLGSKPGAAIGNTLTTTVVIEAVDRATNTVVFRGPSGFPGR